MSASIAALPPGQRALSRELARALQEGLAPLADQPAETVDSTLAALWLAAAGTPVSSRAAATAGLVPLDAGAQARLRTLVRRRLEGVPLAHLTGRQRFMGLEMIASPEALIPREETELLGNAALDALRAAASRGEALAVDACTGSGNLATALAFHEPRARVWATDLSPGAVALARRNAERFGLSDRLTVLAGDLLAPLDATELRGRIDLVVCNPPYISSAKVDRMAPEIRGHEPRLAFDGGPLGIRILARLIDAAPGLLCAGGILAFEVGQGQGPGIRRRLERHGRYAAVREIADAGGEVRALLARTAGTA